MSEEVTGVVGVGDDKSTVAIVVKGKVPKNKVDELKAELKALLKRYGLKVSTVTVGSEK